MRLTSEEIGRKVLHLFSGCIIPAGIFYIPIFVSRAAWPWHGVAPWLYPAAILAAVLAGFVAVEQIRFRVPSVGALFSFCFAAFLRKEESGRMTGATYIVASALICSIVFRHRADISFMVLSTFIWGDAAAALVGISIGRIRIGGKSLEGSLACFALCLFMYMALFPRVPLLLDTWGGALPLPVAVAGSFCTTALELIGLRIGRLELNDNLVVPVVVGGVLLLFGQA